MIEHVNKVEIVNSQTKIIIAKSGSSQDTTAVTVLNAGARGPIGPPGISGPRVEFTVIAGFDIGGHRLVVPRTIAVASVRYAQNTVLLHLGKPIWLTLNAASVGDVLTVVSHGIVEEPTWNWDVGPIFLGDSGLLTQIPPTDPPAVFQCQVGYAVTQTSMFVARTSSVALI